MIHNEEALTIVQEREKEKEEEEENGGGDSTVTKETCSY